MKKTLMVAIALTALSAAFSMPARADSHDAQMNFEMVFKMADRNKDGMVTRAEFLEAMGRAYDMKMAKAKSMKDEKMVKGDAMTRDGIKALIGDVYRGA